MVEKVRNNKSDSVQKKTTYEDIKLPKNLRQVGQISEKKRIYIEDYVMTYIQQLAAKNYGSYQAAVLLGTSQVHEDIDTIFISGAVEVEDVDFDNDKVFDNEAWTTIYSDIKKYFKKAEVVGWYITRPGLSLEVDDKITKIHLDNFAGNDKVLLLYDSTEHEEAFYLYQNKKLVKQSGYYIYYEKNEAMQSYMIEHKEMGSMESDYVDQAGINIRNVLERKNEKEARRSKKGSIRYAVASVAALFILIIAATMLSGVSLNGSKPTSNKKAAIAEATKEAEVPATEEAKTVVKVGDGTSVKEDAEASVDAKVKETPAPAEKPKITEAPKSSSDKSEKKEKAEKKDEDVKVVIDGTTPLPDKKVPDKESKETGASSGKVYEVAKGDTLGSISLKYYKTKSYITKIMELNNIKDADKIYAGQKLKMPDK